MYKALLYKILPSKPESKAPLNYNEEKNININIHRFSSNQALWCDDGSHILKRIRGRLVKYETLYLIPGATTCVNIIFFLENCSEVMSKKAFDKGSLCAMDDWYPSQIFSSDVFYEAITSNNWSLILYLSPLVALNLVIRAKNLTRENRVYLCFFGLFTMLNIYSQIIISQHSKKLEGVHSFFTKQQTITYCNHMVAQLTMLHQNESEFSMGRIGSMVLENFNARIRNMSHENHTFQTFEEAIDKISVLLYFNKDDIESKFRSRWFDFGIADSNYSEPSEEIIHAIIGASVNIAQNSGAIFSKESPLYELQTMSFDHEMVDQVQDKIFYLMSEEAIVQAPSSIFQEKHQKSFRDLCTKGRAIRARNLTK